MVGIQGIMARRGLDSHRRAAPPARIIPVVRAVIAPPLIMPPTVILVTVMGLIMAPIVNTILTLHHHRRPST